MLIDGRRVLSFLNLSVACEGADVHTIEGLATQVNGVDVLHPLREAWLRTVASALRDWPSQAWPTSRGNYEAESLLVKRTADAESFAAAADVVLRDARASGGPSQPESLPRTRQDPEGPEWVGWGLASQALHEETHADHAPGRSMSHELAGYHAMSRLRTTLMTPDKVMTRED